MTAQMNTELSVSLWRGAQDGRYETYRVPQRANQTVLDVVTFVQRHIDPTLSYRFACRVGVCGSCAMTVNGKPRWTCRTHVAKVAGDGRLEIGPLENLRLCFARGRCFGHDFASILANFSRGTLV